MKRFILLPIILVLLVAGCVDLSSDTVDCGSDWNCFIEHAATCTPAKVVTTQEFPDYGALLYDATILGGTASACQVKIHPQSLIPEEGSDAPEGWESANAVIGFTDMTCTLSHSQLASLAFTTNDINNCEGSFADIIREYMGTPTTPTTPTTPGTTPTTPSTPTTGGDEPSRFIPTGMSYDEYQKMMNSKYPVESRVFGCAFDDEACISSKTNPQEDVFGDSVTVTVPAGAALSSLDLTPTILSEEVEDGEVFYSLSFPDAQFLEFVRVFVPLPDGADAADYVAVDGNGIEHLVTPTDGGGYFLTDHFSNWEFRVMQRHPEPETVMGTLSGTAYIDMDSGSVFASRLKVQLGGGSAMTDESGNFVIRTSQAVIDNVASDKGAEIKLFASMPGAVVYPTGALSAPYYSSVVLKNEGGAVKAVFKPTGDTLDAFRILDRIRDVQAFWKGRGALDDGFRNVQVWVKYKSADGSFFWRSPLTGAKEMYLNDDFNQDMAMGDANGDTIAHEYMHFVNFFKYGIGAWDRLNRGTAEHIIGRPTSVETAFKEDVAYFSESVFDGRRLADLGDDANMAKEIPSILSTWQARKNSYVAAKTEAKKKLVVDFSKEFFMANAEIIEEFNQDNFRIDGFGALVLWDMYERRGDGFFTDFWETIKQSKPSTFRGFMAAYQSKFGQERFDELNATVSKYGGNVLWRELDPFWAEECLTAGDCDDGDPCTADWCVEGGYLQQGLIGGITVTCSAHHPCQNPQCAYERKLVKPFTENPSEIAVSKVYTYTYDSGEVLCCDYGSSYVNMVFKSSDYSDAKVTHSNFKCCDDSDCVSGGYSGAEYDMDIYVQNRGQTVAKCVSNYCVYSQPVKSS